MKHFTIVLILAVVIQIEILGSLILEHRDAQMWRAQVNLNNSIIDVLYSMR